MLRLTPRWRCTVKMVPPHVLTWSCCLTCLTLSMFPLQCMLTPWVYWSVGHCLSTFLTLPFVTTLYHQMLLGHSGCGQLIQRWERTWTYLMHYGSTFFSDFHNSSSCFSCWKWFSLFWCPGEKARVSCTHDNVLVPRQHNLVTRSLLSILHFLCSNCLNQSGWWFKTFHVHWWSSLSFQFNIKGQFQILPNYK